MLNVPGWHKYTGDKNVKNIQGALVYIQLGPQVMCQQNVMGLSLEEPLTNQQPIGLSGY